MIGGIGKALTSITQIDPAQLSKLSGGMKKEEKETQQASVSAKKLGALFKEIESGMSSIGGLLGQVAKAAQVKPKDSKVDQEALKKDVMKAMDSFQKQRIKFLEGKIAETEKELATLKKYLANLKGTNTSGWFK